MAEPGPQGSLKEVSRALGAAPREEEKLKVCRIIARLNVGGPALHAIFLSQRPSRGPWDTLLIHGTPGEREGDLAPLARERGVRCAHVPELGRAVRPLDDLRTLWKLYRILCREKPHIVHTHTAKAGALGRVAALLYRLLTPGLLRLRPRPLRVYHTFHGHVLRGYFPPWKSRLFRRVEALLARITTRLITLSPALKEELVALGVAPPERIAVVPLGLELERHLACETKRGAFRGEQGIDEGTRLVGIVGRLVPIKNHALFLEGAKALLEHPEGGVSPPVRFIVVGDGELRGELEAMARAYGLGEKVSFTGWREDTDAIYADLDAVALTSDNEGTPVSLIEAMAAGVPVVATRVGGAADLLESSGEEPPGILIPPREPGALAEAFLRVLSDRERARAMGSRGRELVRERYTVERLTGDLAALYGAARR